MTKKIDHDSRAAIHFIEDTIEMYETILSRLKKKELLAVLKPGVTGDYGESDFTYIASEGNSIYPPFKEKPGEGNVTSN